ncbi:hypothetical protein WG947_04630 [Pontibacter sp. H259]|uniref:hypothetical protein n=1 Tax=Pontibacter sp. H259 TaxID=3133421 RepID=UPI0030BE237A
MNIKIPAPYGLTTSLISLSDIVRIENCSLTFFKATAYNLYIIEKAEKGEEVFSLFSYHQKQDMLFAYNTIIQLLKDKKNKSITLEMEPMKGALT